LKDLQEENERIELDETEGFPERDEWEKVDHLARFLVVSVAATVLSRKRLSNDRIDSYGLF